MAYGVTAQGFERPRLPEIREEIVVDLKRRLREQGPDDNIETRPDSVFGLLIDTFAERETALWEMGEGVYYGMYPGSATGAALDRAVSFTGVTRRVAERSTVTQTLYGTVGTLVPAGSQVRNRVTQSLWETTSDATITPTAATDLTVVPEVVASTAYTITVGGTAYTYTSGATTSLSVILAGIVGALSGAALNVSSNGAAVRMTTYSSAPVDASLGTNLTFTQVGSPVQMQTLEFIAEPVSAGDLNAIVTRVDGWTATNNLQSGTVGRVAETDAELQARYGTGLFRLGAGTLPSISVNIRDRVPGITAIKVLSNDTDIVNDIGDKPHSVHVIVEGGLTEQIADALYRVKGGGIDTNGDVSVVLQTQEGEQTILFDRPTYQYIWVQAVLTILPPSEEQFPSNGFALVKKAIAATGAAHGIGQDVIAQRFHCAIYGAAAGIGEVDLQFAHSTNPMFEPNPGDFSAANITIAEFELARFDISRVEVS